MAQSEPDTQELDWIRRAQRGEHDAFGRLVERYRKQVFGLVYHLVRNANDVEDLAQEIFIKIFKGIGGYNFQSPFRSWVSRVAVNHCYDYLRRIRSSRVSTFAEFSEASQFMLEARPPLHQNPGEDFQQQMEVRDLALQLLSRAPEEDRGILVMKEIEGRPVEEIAAILDLKMATVKVRLHRARKRMLEDYKRMKQGRKGHAM